MSARAALAMMLGDGLGENALQAAWDSLRPSARTIDGGLYVLFSDVRRVMSAMGYGKGAAR